MRTIRVAPTEGNDPTFGTPGEAISWRSPRDESAKADSMKIRGMTVAEVFYSDTAFLVEPTERHLGWLSFRLADAHRPEAVLWSIITRVDEADALRGCLPYSARTASQPTTLVFSEFSAFWDPAMQLRSLIGITLAKLYATNDAIYLYPMVGPPLAIQDMLNLDAGERLLFVQWDDPA